MFAQTASVTIVSWWVGRNKETESRTAELYDGPWNDHFKTRLTAGKNHGYGFSDETRVSLVNFWFRGQH